MVSSQLVLEGAVFVGQPVGAVFRLKPNSPGLLGDLLGIGADLEDLIEHEPLVLMGRYSTAV